VALECRVCTETLTPHNCRSVQRVRGTATICGPCYLKEKAAEREAKGEA